MEMKRVCEVIIPGLVGLVLLGVGGANNTCHGFTFPSAPGSNWQRLPTSHRIRHYYAEAAAAAAADNEDAVKDDSMLEEVDVAIIGAGLGGIMCL